MKQDEKEQIIPEPEYTPPKTSIAVDEGFESIFGCDENSTMEQRFDALMQVMTANAFYLMDRMRSKGKKPSVEEKEFQEECMMQLTMINKVFLMAKKAGRIGSRPNENYDNELLARVVRMKGSMADIVQTVPVNKKEAPNA
jgi:hypothetical protein